MSTYLCTRCNRTDTHRHCERCAAHCAFPPFHCHDCTRILCGRCQQKGCCGELPARETAPEPPVQAGGFPWLLVIVLAVPAAVLLYPVFKVVLIGLQLMSAKGGL